MGMTTTTASSQSFSTTGSQNTTNTHDISTNSVSTGEPPSIISWSTSQSNRILNP
jgi:hypothetical protein